LAAVVFAWTPMAAFFGWLLVVKPLLVILITPVRDALRIKRDFEGQGRVVADIRRSGTDWGTEFQLPTYRKYVIKVRRHDGVTADFLVGVAFGFSSDADLIVYDNKSRDAFFRGSDTFFQ
jgi:hypothetical protein